MYEIKSQRLRSDDIGNLEGLLEVVFIDEKRGNLKAVIDGGEFTRN